MTRGLWEGVRELRLHPAQPVRVYVLGMQVELRRIGGEMAPPVAVSPGVPDRTGQLRAAMRLVEGGRRWSDA
jgi:hypothetical protein